MDLTPDEKTLISALIDIAWKVGVHSPETSDALQALKAKLSSPEKKA